MAAATVAAVPSAVKKEDPAAIVDLSSDEDADSTSRDSKHADYLKTDASINDRKSEDLDEDDTSSLTEDIVNLSEIEEFEYAKTTGPDLCTVEEAQEFRSRLHEIGIDQFIRETITKKAISAKKLCTAFGIRIPAGLFDVETDESYYPFLGLAITREFARRPRLEQYTNIDHAANLLQTAKNIVVITGAGISTSLGIPDFRSKNTGFYAKLQDHGYEDPQEVFDIHHFDEDPSTFYKLAGDILPDMCKWTPTHEFIHLLQQKDKLLTNYTQNIDNLESQAGILSEKLIQCHGSFATATCRKCDYKVPGEEIFNDIRHQKVSECPRCVETLKAPQRSGVLKRKRSSNSHGGKGKRRKSSEEDHDSDGDYDIPQPGVMKPDIIFFGEGLPKEFFSRLKEQDTKKVDLLIVIGTSMQVAPVSEIPQIIPKDVPQIYISRDPVKHINFDIQLLGDCDVVVGELCRRANWELKHKMHPPGQQVDITPFKSNSGHGNGCSWTIKARK
ncbi:SIR2-domain-containing protein [Patellaria atrata CBS 101060]|uniref:SIR2-domain-containing protein n=1 Tax=Patellaria atrata CBS 101060 TaxID=1346257 RepID=A0A9P4SH21_9PEZI|nr:SIR2-domain-containing protein [Patellaria atrata CBS 101060]